MLHSSDSKTKQNKKIATKPLEGLFIFMTAISKSYTLNRYKRGLFTQQTNMKLYDNIIAFPLNL